MNALLIAATVAMCSATSHGVVVGQQYLVMVAICEGDPLGTREAGTVEILSRPQLVLTAGQQGFFQVGQTLGDVSVSPVGLILRATLTPLPGGKVQAKLSYEHRSVIALAADGAVVRETSSQQDRVLVLGQPTTLRLAAESATKQTWVIVTAHAVGNEAQMGRIMADRANGAILHRFARKP